MLCPNKNPEFNQAEIEIESKIKIEIWIEIIIK
jgi:hypothetical protein